MSGNLGRYIAIETSISIAFSVAFNVGVSWVVLHNLDEIALFEAPGLGVGFIPAAFMTTFMITLATTFLTRMRRRAGSAPSVPLAPSRLPRNAIVRAVVVGLVATIVIVPVVIGTLMWLSPGPYSLNFALLVNGIFGAALAIILAPRLLKVALSES